MSDAEPGKAVRPPRETGWSILLPVLFYGVVLPFGLLMGLIGMRPIPVGYDQRLKSYWVKREPIRDPARHIRRQD